AISTKESSSAWLSTPSFTVVGVGGSVETAGEPMLCLLLPVSGAADGPDDGAGGGLEAASFDSEAEVTVPPGSAASTPPGCASSGFGLLGVAAVPLIYARAPPASRATADPVGLLVLAFQVATAFALLFAPAWRFCNFNCDPVLPSRVRKA